MKRSDERPAQPSEGELEILHVLWDRGTATVREIHEHLAEGRPAQYTTTLKQLQVMTGKGLVTRDDSERSHVFRAAVTRAAVQRRATARLLQRVFRGSGPSLLMQLLGTKRHSKAELAELRSILEEYEKGKDK
jgi:predicted transcriptional regulator